MGEFVFRVRNIGPKRSVRFEVQPEGCDWPRKNSEVKFRLVRNRGIGQGLEIESSNNIVKDVLWDQMEIEYSLDIWNPPRMCLGPGGGIPLGNDWDGLSGASQITMRVRAFLCDEHAEPLADDKGEKKPPFLNRTVKVGKHTSAAQVTVDYNACDVTQGTTFLEKIEDIQRKIGIITDVVKPLLRPLL